ncbi:hypothetical protein E6O75_ATG08662 [Venturia nashicola]|uniref:Uncharacterized protein n=1 Tax=Venturia nashicola TaxID=86259 RepID=A0A4Z1NU40_9PEZI|nr:hypothetical protein E6O75_ATG08662 [Venturia nashicola]
MRASILTLLLPALTLAQSCPYNQMVITAGGCGVGLPCDRPTKQEADAACQSMGKRWSTTQNVGPGGLYPGEQIRWICCSSLPKPA